MRLLWWRPPKEEVEELILRVLNEARRQGDGWMTSLEVHKELCATHKVDAGIRTLMVLQCLEAEDYLEARWDPNDTNYYEGDRQENRPPRRRQYRIKDDQLPGIRHWLAQRSTQKGRAGRLPGIVPNPEAA